MVVKVRGELYSIHLHDNLEKNPTMIIGIDSSKVGKGKTKIIMASSFTKAFSRFYTEQQVTDNGEELSGWAVSPSGRYILTTFGGYKFCLYDREKAISEDNSEILSLPEPEKTFDISDCSYVNLNNSGTICYITDNGPVFIK